MGAGTTNAVASVGMMNNPPFFLTQRAPDLWESARLTEFYLILSVILLSGFYSSPPTSR
jgi:hypothetical protein